jgi:Clp amino terminal domain, pathogenicity island component
MALTLGVLIEDVEATAPTREPLDLLATASASVQIIDELTDAMLSHFVDRCRRAGHSWAEIGAALGVTKQAVQKRFTAAPHEPLGIDRFTPRASRLVQVHAPAAAAMFGHSWIGTEHLLLGFYAEPEALAPVILITDFRLDRDKVVAAIDARTERGEATERTFTPRAWAAIQSCTREALMLGHNYIGTEHQLLALLSGVGGMAADILADANITRDRVTPKVIERLAAYIQKKRQ